jgi:hypothetical protein
VHGAKEQTMGTLRRTSLIWSIAAVSALLLAPVIVSGGSAAASSAPRPALPGSSKTIVLTRSSNGASVVAMKGDLVIVHLEGGRLRWSEASVPPSSSAATSVLKRLSGRTHKGASTTTFEVENHGTAQLQATGTPKCGASLGCTTVILLWQATVNVPVVDPPPPPLAPRP